MFEVKFFSMTQIVGWTVKCVRQMATSARNVLGWKKKIRFFFELFIFDGSLRYGLGKLSTSCNINGFHPSSQLYVCEKKQWKMRGESIISFYPNFSIKYHIMCMIRSLCISANCFEIKSITVYFCEENILVCLKSVKCDN